MIVQWDTQFIFHIAFFVIVILLKLKLLFWYVIRKCIFPLYGFIVFIIVDLKKISGGGLTKSKLKNLALPCTLAQSLPSLVMWQEGLILGF